MLDENLIGPEKKLGFPHKFNSAYFIRVNFCLVITYHFKLEEHFPGDICIGFVQSLLDNCLPLKMIGILAELKEELLYADPEM